MTLPRFIAEVSSNHNGDLDRAVAFVRKAAQMGCWGVKFQLFRIRELFAPEALTAKPSLWERRDWELPTAFVAPIARACRDAGIAFGCTPFYREAVELLAPHVDFFKIASYELLWTDLIADAAATGKPLYLSCGMATLDEVDAAVRCARQAGATAITVLHCVSSYPTPPQACNLAAIPALRAALGLPVGWSDHSVCAGVWHRAVHKFDAAAIEFHLDLDGTGWEYGGGHCWLPDDAAAAIAAVTQGCAADGDGRKEPSEAEAVERMWRADPSDGLRPLLATRQEIAP